MALSFCNRGATRERARAHSLQKEDLRNRMENAERRMKNEENKAGGFRVFLVLFRFFLSKFFILRSAFSVQLFILAF